jgi:hypothetical protein
MSLEVFVEVRGWSAPVPGLEFPPRLEALSFEGGKRLSLQGQAPADQVSSLEDVRTKLQAAKGHGGEDLFRSSASQATMHMPLRAESAVANTTAPNRHGLAASNRQRLIPAGEPVDGEARF